MRKKMHVNFKRTVFMAILMLLGSGMAANAQIAITGTVQDKTQEPLIGVSVLVKGTTIGVITDMDGKYTVNVPDAGSVLVFSYIGYTTQEIRVDSKRQIDVVLQDDAKLLDEVVVVGYGTQRKSDLTGGIATISGDDINGIPAVSLTQRLQGQVAGMNITLDNARPGEDGTILIRGTKTLTGSTAPLIVLDGIPFSGTMAEIDQNSVENISILKDASSASIYGARATNGVILITTKKGVVGKPTVRYNGYIGIQQAQRLPDMMNGEEYLRFIKDYRKDSGDKNWDDPTKYFQSALQDNYKNGVTNDWVDYMFENAVQMEHQLSVSGATEGINYYLSFTYADQQSILKEAKGYKKYGVTANLSQNIGDFIKVGTNIQLIERSRAGREGEELAVDNVSIDPKFAYGLRMSPFASIKDDEGKYIHYPMYGENMYYSPYADHGAIKDDKSRAAYLSGFVQIDAPWIKGLSYRANMGYSYRQRDRGIYYNKQTMTGAASSGKAIVQANQNRGWTWENVITYVNSWGKHNLNLTGLYSAEKQYMQSSRIDAEDFLSDSNKYHNLVIAKGLKKLQSDKENTQLLAYMFRANYSYDSRYLLTVTGRRDGSSVYGKGNKWQFFPSVAGGWVISEESFFKNLNLKAVDYLKLRLSYGSNGNIYSKPYKTFTKLTDQDYIFGNDNEVAGGLISGFDYGNPKLKWEKTNTFNLGLDFYLLDNARIRGALDFYRSSTTNLLMKRTVPVMNGYASLEDNVGEVQNRGIELSLNTDNIVGKDFKWSSTLVLATNRDKIVELQRDPEGNQVNDITNSWFIGEPVRAWFDYKVIGIWQIHEADEAAKYKAVPGDAKIWDKDGSGTINADDRVVIGSKAPRWTAGLTNTFQYKNVSLSFFLNGSFGAWKKNETIKYERQLFEKNVNYLRNIDYWTPENPSNKYTRLGYKTATYNFFKKVNFVRLQDINLAYHFPKSILNKVGLKELTTYVNARNVFTFSNANKYTTNVEQEIYSLDSTGYPVQRTFIFGVNLTF